MIGTETSRCVMVTRPGAPSQAVDPGAAGAAWHRWASSPAPASLRLLSQPLMLVLPIVFSSVEAPQLSS